MTDTDINIAVAEACGWKKCQPCLKNGYFDQWRLPSDDGCIHTTQLPNYFHDLNAMHEAECYAFIHMFNPDDYGLALLKIENDRPIFNSTALQRAEAFLRTVGKWKE